MTTGPRSLRLGEVGAEAEHLAAQLSEATGRRITLSDYVREALVERNRWARRILAAEEIPGGDVIVSGADVNVGGRTLGPGVYRVRGTTELITVGEVDAPD